MVGSLQQLGARRLDHTMAETQGAVMPSRALALTPPPVAQPTSLFHRIWPPAAIAIGLIATVAWMGLLGYGLFQLIF